MNDYVISFQFEYKGAIYEFRRSVNDESYTRIVMEELNRIQKTYNTTDITVRRELF
jgi:hypothetical protein